MSSLVPESCRLRFVHYREGHEAAFKSLFSNREVMKHVDKGAMSPAETEALWRRLIDDFYPNGKTTIWAVLDNCDETYVGHAAIRPRPTNPNDWEISYIIGNEFWGRGFGTEIARGLVEFGFNQLNLTEIFATIDDDNEPSIRIAGKAGMKFLRYEYDAAGRFSVFRIKRPSS